MQNSNYKKQYLNVLVSSIFLFLVSIANLSIAQQPVPALPQTKSILLKGGIAHLGNGKVIENSLIAFKDGKIILVADATTARVDFLKYDEVIDVFGKHIYPGFIAPNSTLGLTEVDAVRATIDMAEVGAVIPNVRSIIAYNTDSKITPTARANGVLLAQITPRSGLISGTSSIVELDGWNWEDATYKIDDGIHLNWPQIYARKSSQEEAQSVAENKEGQKQLNELKKLFEDAKAYSEIESHEEKNLKLESISNLFNGKQTLFIHANYVKEITEALNFAKQFDIKKTVIVGGKDAWKVAALLKENNVPVIVSRLHDLPLRPEDDIDLPYKLPYLLHKAGVLFCLNNEGDMEAAQTRNLPFYAGTAAAYGLTKEDALMAITFNTAKILGIDERVGSIETEKDATLIVSTGDALDMKSNNIEIAFIRGKALDLNTEQKALYRKYKTKYGLN